MNKKILILTIAILAITIYAKSQNKIELIAEAPKTVVQGNSFTIMYKLNNIEEGNLQTPNIQIPPMQSFYLLKGPITSSNTNISILNGKVIRTIEYSYTYTFRANKTGTFEIPTGSVIKY